MSALSQPHSLCCPQPRAAALSPRVLQKELSSRLERCSPALLWLQRRGFVLGHHCHEGRGISGWERMQGACSEEGASLEGNPMWLSLESSPWTTFLVFLSSHSLITAQLPGGRLPCLLFPCLVSFPSFPCCTHTHRPKVSAPIFACQETACLQGSTVCTPVFAGINRHIRKPEWDRQS